jgi:hypothetical protein
MPQRTNKSISPSAVRLGVSLVAAAHTLDRQRKLLPARGEASEGSLEPRIGWSKKRLSQDTRARNSTTLILPMLSPAIWVGGGSTFVRSRL